MPSPRASTVVDAAGAAIRADAFDERGQGTVEFALVTAAFWRQQSSQLGALWRS